MCGMLISRQNETCCWPITAAKSIVKQTAAQIASRAGTMPSGAAPGRIKARNTGPCQCRPQTNKASAGNDVRRRSTFLRIDVVSHQEAIEKGLKVMDVTAISLAMENGLDLCVFDISQPGNITRALSGERMGSLITSKEQQP